MTLRAPDAARRARAVVASGPQRSRNASSARRSGAARRTASMRPLNAAACLGSREPCATASSAGRAPLSPVSMPLPISLLPMGPLTAEFAFTYAWPSRAAQAPGTQQAALQRGEEELVDADPDQQDDDDRAEGQRQVQVVLGELHHLAHAR